MLFDLRLCQQLQERPQENLVSETAPFKTTPTANEQPTFMTSQKQGEHEYQ